MSLDLMTTAKRLLTPTQRLLMTWWRRQSPSRQDRFATLGPLVSVLLFLAAIITAFWYLRNEETERESEAVKRDAEVAQQQIRLRLIENQEQLVRIARELMTHQIDVSEFVAQAGAFSRDRPEITHLSWVAAHRTLRSSVSGAGLQADNVVDPDRDDPSMPAEGANGIPNAPELAFEMARERHQVVYSPPFSDNIGTAVFQVQVPLIERGSFNGVLVAEYSIEGLLRYYVPTEVGIRHPIDVINAREQTLASTVTPMPGQKPRKAAVIYDVPLAPAVNGLVLRVEGYRTSVGLIGNTLFWMVVALSWLTVWMLLGTWKHMRRRLQIQNALINETNFRRAMENSMLTGMRAMDMDSRISYVNPAFCAMTGFSEAELIGRKPPFPYWPLDRYEENSRLLQQEVQGRSPAGGVEVKVMRRDGTIFDARMYVSPLIDPKGKQTGWMTSMTNITEAKRVRDQLSAAHERFTTVLEGLDAAVSVLSVQENEGLFANRSYRLWFGADAGGHALLAGSQIGLPTNADPVDEYSGLPSAHATEQINEFGSDPREVFVESLDMWFDVRARYLQWTDGRLAQMLIATDITARRRAEELQARQAERAQVTSRLMTMGEMASSVAHELNQPLTAITNYCNGMVYRVRDDNIKREDLLVALEKTAKQAQRAGQIIHRIRNFVKRSEPQRQSSHAYDIVEDAVELAGIELRRRGVAIHTYVAQRLPALMVDPILIEQVLMNLLKNAAEAIDNANLSVSRRHIELRVIPKHTPELGGHVEFSVTDMGPGLPEEVINRMYEAFFSTKADGLGIGLGLCRSIVESHQGRIKAENLYNGPTVVGCRFAFTIPVDIPRAESSGTALNTAATQ